MTNGHVEAEQPQERRRLRVPLAVAYLLAVVAMLANYLGLAPFLLIALIPGASKRVQALPIAAQVPLAFLQNLGVAAMAVLIVWLLMRFVCRRGLREAGFFFTARSVPMLLVGVAASVVVAVPNNAGAGPVGSGRHAGAGGAAGVGVRHDQPHPGLRAAGLPGGAGLARLCPAAAGPAAAGLGGGDLGDLRGDAPGLPR